MPMKRSKFRPGSDWVWYAPHTHDVFGEREIQAVVASLKNGWLTLGKISKKFEYKVAKLFGKKYALFVNSGSSANLLALRALNFSPGMEVITPACNFNTTVSPIIQSGLTPVFIDVNMGEYTAQARLIEKAISKKTVAVMIPDLLGNFADLRAIKSICKKYKLVFIEDSCDTIGGLFDGKPSGKWSDVVTTSFYASHSVTAGGSGGMLMSDDKILLEKARVLRDWGRGISFHNEDISSRLSSYKIDDKPYDSAFVFTELGYNFKPTEMQAAFALEQLKRLRFAISARSLNYRRLHDFFKRYDKYFFLPESSPRNVTNWLAFPLTIKKSAPFGRNDLVRYLEKRKIQTRPLFSGNITKHPAYNNVKYKISGRLAISQYVLEQSFLIGVHHGLNPKMLKYVKYVFNEYLKSFE